MSDTRPDRGALERAWRAARCGFTIPPSGGFDAWYDQTYPPPLPVEPPIGSVRGGRWGGADFVWHRRHDGLWYSAGKGGVTACSWAEAIAAGLDPDAPYARC